MQELTTVGIDLAKSAFAVHAVAPDGRVVLRRMVSRGKLMEVIARLPPSLIGMESCSGAHEWARRFQGLGHSVRLMAPVFVAPYRKSGKNDGNDAEAICEAVVRPSMRFVPIKTLDQQAMLTLHRVRQGFVTERTAVVNRIRGLLAEFGIALAQGVESLRRDLHASSEGLPGLACRAIRDLQTHLRVLDQRISEYDRELKRLASENDDAQRLQTIPGIGPITASAMVASVGSALEFRNGRQFAAWLGLTPRQFSSGGKTRLGHISKRGDAYLRMLLVLGARSVLQNAARYTDRLSRWVLSIRSRCGYHKAIVAIAAKNARILWVVMAKKERFKTQPA
jgi:transposase